MRLTLTEANCRLLNVNPRPELHGEDKKAAADLKITTHLPNTELAQFHPNLKHLLYVKDSDRPDLVSQADPEHATMLRFPQLLAPLKWQGEIVGAAITVHRGISAKSDLKIEGCLVNEFRLEPMEGGSVAVTFRVQFHPDEKTIGRLCMLTGTDVVVSVAPPEEAQEPLDSLPNTAQPVYTEDLKA
jgi:hypothetical protein